MQACQNWSYFITFTLQNIYPQDGGGLCIVIVLPAVGDANGASRYPRYQPPMLAATTGIVHSSTDPVHPSVAHSGAGHADTYHMSARGDSIH